MGIPERKEREKEIRRQQILKAGEELFISQGLQHTTMEQIANKVEISRGTLYLYFKSKEDLFQTLLINSMDLFSEMLRNNINDSEPIEKKLTAIGSTYLNFYRNYRNYFKLLNYMEDSENINFDNIEEPQLIFNKSQQIWEIIVNVLKEGVEQGYFKQDINPFEIAIIFWTSSNGIIQVIDHINYAHNNDKSKDLTNTQCSDFQTFFENMNLEKMLTKLWDFIIAGIRNNN